MFYALVDTVAGTVRDGSIQDFSPSDPPPQLAPAKGLRWLPVTDIRPTPGADEILDGPDIAITTDKVLRVWTARAKPAA